MARRDLPASCRTCGREFTPRRPEQTRCSERCRRHRPTSLDRELEQAILELLKGRARGATICPSEAARRVAPERWRGLMESCRQAARRLAARRLIEVRQRGRRVDPLGFRGPIRLALFGAP